jgi:VanZ family protein
MPYRRLAAIAFAFAVLAVCWGSLQPSLAPPGENQVDKMVHLVAFAVLSGLGWVAWERPAARVAMLVGLVALGVGIEACQTAIPGRKGSALDVAADLAGLAAGIAPLLALRALRRRIAWSPGT